MKEVTKIVFEREDNIIQKIEEAFRLIGGQAWDEKDPRHKPFRRIRGNDATRGDCREAVQIVRDEAERQAAEAKNAPCPFPEQEEGSTRVADGWRAGHLRTLDRALQRAESFIEAVDDALDNA